MGKESESKYKRHCGYEGGAHYSMFSFKAQDGMACLREMFPDGEANELNFVLFSTSGVHGWYTTIEEVEFSLTKYGPNPEFLRDYNEEEVPEDYTCAEVTVVVVQPRICCMRYGNVAFGIEDLDFLKRLRQTSWDACITIGRPEAPATADTNGKD